MNGDDQPITSTGPTYPAQAPLVSLAQTVTRPPAGPGGGPSLPPTTPQDDDLADERVLLNVLRLLNRTFGPTPLTPVQRAFVAGAKVMFEQLAVACDQMLRRQVLDLPPPAPEMKPPADPSAPPRSVGPGPAEKPTGRKRDAS